jgi:hypothetical protein
MVNQGRMPHSHVAQYLQGGPSQFRARNRDITPTLAAGDRHHPITLVMTCDAHRLV